MSARERGEVRLDALADSIDEPWKPIGVETVDDPILRTKQYGEGDAA